MKSRTLKDLSDLSSAMHYDSSGHKWKPFQLGKQMGNVLSSLYEKSSERFL